MSEEELYIKCFYYASLIIVLITIIAHIFPKVSNTFNILLATLVKHSENRQVVTYSDRPLSHISMRRLEMVKRKTLVLDMDETLITSIVDRGNRRLPDMPHDFAFMLPDRSCVFHVYKRPHVDLFLDMVSQWYNIVIYTAAHELYATGVLDRLDNGRDLLGVRMFRQHCIPFSGRLGKLVGLITDDLASVLIVDNADISCGLNYENSIRIKSFRLDQRDTALLNLLPFLDALRFMKDVRTILRRNKRCRGVYKALFED